MYEDWNTHSRTAQPHGDVALFPQQMTLPTNESACECIENVHVVGTQRFATSLSSYASHPNKSQFKCCNVQIVRRHCNIAQCTPFARVWVCVPLRLISIFLASSRRSTQLIESLPRWDHKKIERRKWMQRRTQKWPEPNGRAKEWAKLTLPIDFHISFRSISFVVECKGWIVCHTALEERERESVYSTEPPHTYTYNTNTYSSITLKWSSAEHTNWPSVASWQAGWHPNITHKT